MINSKLKYIFFTIIKIKHFKIMNTRGSFDNPGERLFYVRTVVKFIKDHLQINNSIEDLCNKFNENIVVSDISCPALIPKESTICGKKTNYKNIYGLCNYHYYRFIQEGSILIGKEKDIYRKIKYEEIYEDKECRHPRCKVNIDSGDYCAKHSNGNDNLCNKKLKNGNKCRRFRTKDSFGNRQKHCKIHLTNEESGSFKFI
jgi:hypothetical protein